MKHSGSSLLGSLFATLFALNGVMAGLEDAKHSTKLDHANFDVEIAKPEVGTLVAFFAPWCGHCKSLKGAWDRVGLSFRSDSKCRVAHLDANEASNKDIASRFSVSGFPTIKFLYKDSSKPALDYSGARSPEAFINFLNEQCGTHRAAGGLLLPEAGRVASLDTLVASFVGLPTAERPSVLKQATELASSVKDGMAAYYVKAMKKVNTDDGWLSKEASRLKKLAEKGATMSTEKFEELQMKQNILEVFISAKGTASAAGEKLSKAAESVKEGAKAAAEAVKGKTEEVVGKATDEL
ncbi:hypothetical protein CROQUDRAFT_658331 [Cronartium quercuum f. sp. fusiforme G11]|uniref:protein disulfide-isomerase n=1 Tax=Cronartium quercuum f. sp. fusiforme G11 TaxID=708437 RepID=A0A9P6TBG4_9BASI|nr:hypothetical protein CROQUDRAFT_658331 [Cronartium quercuum f. sp. fusiforme G11]